MYWDEEMRQRFPPKDLPDLTMAPPPVHWLNPNRPPRATRPASTY
jgi:hypothetical protein